jgi:multiple sugar transport system substrate-binding protein
MDSFWPRVLADRKAGLETWDILYVGPREQGAAVQLNIVNPFSDVVDQMRAAGAVDEERLDFDDFVSGATKPTSFKGKLVSIPISFNGVLMAYRTDWFTDPIEKKAFKEKYGYDLTPPKTYKQFYDVSEFFTRKEGETLGGKKLERGIYGTTHSNKKGNFLWHDYLNYQMAFGGDIIYDPKTRRPTMNSPESIAAGEYYLKLTKFLPSGHLTMTSGGSSAMFAEGQVAMVVEYPSRLFDIATNPKKSKVIGKMEFALPPSQEGVSGREHALHVGGQALGIYSLSKNKKAAYTLLEIGLSKEYMKKMCLERAAVVPSRKSVLEDPEVLAKWPHIKILKKVDEAYTFVHPPDLPEYPQMIGIVAEELHQALAGMKSIRQAFDAAQLKLERLFKQAGYIK